MQWQLTLGPTPTPTRGIVYESVICFWPNVTTLLNYKKHPKNASEYYAILENTNTPLFKNEELCCKKYSIWYFSSIDLSKVCITHPNITDVAGFEEFLSDFSKSVTLSCWRILRWRSLYRWSYCDGLDWARIICIIRNGWFHSDWIIPRVHISKNCSWDWDRIDY